MPAAARLARVWTALTLVQIGFLVFFSSLLVFVIDGQRIWAVSDDIYISACYARSLAHGAGAVWYPGTPPVEGFSNPLWTLLLAGVHALPFFREEQLGLYVLLLQVALLSCASALAFGILRRLLRRAGGSLELTPLRAATLLLVSLGASALPFWLADGFEIALVLVFALWALRIALADARSTKRALGIGLLCAACTWTRMDGVLVCAPALFVLLREPRWTREDLGFCALGFALPVAALFGLRYAIFGEWLPNTYYLKLSGWPLADRLARGVRTNWPIFPALALAWGAFALPRTRLALGEARHVVFALLATATGLVLYSCHNGGDSWNLRFGYDRFSAPGALLLGIALSLAVLRLGTTRRELWASLVVAVQVALSPLLFDPSLAYTTRLVTGSYARSEQRSMIEDGRAFEACSKPGAKVVLGAAGAIVYFSHRGAYDALGKCDPWVARQPVNAPDFTSGHNKRYLDAIFERDSPEFSNKLPPQACIERYVECTSLGRHIWVRRDGPNVLWDKLQIVKK